MRGRSGHTRTADDVVRRRVSAEVRAMRPYSVPDLPCRVKLDGNESPYPLPEPLAEKAVAALQTVEINRYPDPEARRLKTAAAAFLGVETRSIMFGNGSDELISIAMTTFSSCTRKVLYPVPTFSMFSITAATLGLERVEVPLERDFDLATSPMMEAIELEDPDAVFLASPNNPTGNRFSTDRIEAVLEAARGVVVIDEAYADFSGHTMLGHIDRHPNLVVLRTMSKIGFASLRLGIAVAHPTLIGEMNKVRLPYNINSLTQAVAEVVLSHGDLIRDRVAEVVRERARMWEALKAVEGITPYRSDANFILMRVEDADALFERLVEQGVLVRNLSSPGVLEGCLRVTVGAPEENDYFLAALRRALSRTT